MSIIKQILRKAAPLPDIENYGRYLFIAPHPDDIEVGAGATAAKLAAAGKTVCYLVCTDGRYGEENCPADSTEQLIARRREEQLASAAAAGVKDVRFGSLSDGGLYREEELVDLIAKTIGEFRPEVIFAPDPDVTSECHADHLAVGRTAKKLAFFAPFDKIMKCYGAAGAAPVEALAMYMTAKPNRYVDTTGFLPVQMHAMFDCHLSQFPKDSDAAKSLSTYMKLRAYDFGIRSLHRTAEGFRVLGRTQMHAMPEAGN